MLDLPLASCGPWRISREGGSLFLWENSTTWMTDRDDEKQTHQQAIDESHRRGGHVLTTGLGLGAFADWCLESASVSSVTIVERCLDVVNLVWPTLSAKHASRVELILADAELWEPRSRYTVIWHDFWQLPHSEEAKAKRAMVEASYAVTCTNWTTTAGTLTFGTSTITLSGWNFAGTLSAAAATFVVGSTATTFAGGGATYGTVSVATGGSTLTFTGSNTFAQMTATGGSTKTIKFTAGTTTTLTGGSNAFFSGSASNLITIQSTTGGSAWNMSKSSGIVSCDYLSLQDSAAAGGAAFYAGANSTNVSGNSGWSFTAAPASGGYDLYSYGHISDG